MHKPKQMLMGPKMIALAIVALTCCSGCAVRTALFDGLYLGVSDLVAAAIRSAVSG